MRTYEKKALEIFREHGGEVVAAFKPEPATDGMLMPDPKRLAPAGERKRVIKKTAVFVSKSGKNPYLKSRGNNDRKSD